MDMTVRPLVATDRFEVAELIYASINVWYQQHGLSPIFVGGPRVTEVFQDVYEALDPGCAVVAENPTRRAICRRTSVRSLPWGN